MTRFFKKKPQSEKKQSSSSDWVMGKHSIEEALKYSSRSIKEIFIAKSHQRDDPIVRAAEKEGIRINWVSKDYLTDQLQSDSHQGYAAKVKPFFYHDPLEFIEKTTKNADDSQLYVALDSIYDPHNFGAILRASECFGVSGVIYSKNRGVDLTAAVSKASVGASLLMPLLKVSNLVEAVKKFKEEGFEVITAEISKEAVPLDSFTFNKKTLLILGSEGEGVRTLLSEQADKKLYIKMFGKIDSLNVSQATSVLLFNWRVSLSRNS